jgi:predicted proteasome-type protease
VQTLLHRVLQQQLVDKLYDATSVQQLTVHVADTIRDELKGDHNPLSLATISRFQLSIWTGTNMSYKW